MKLKPDDVRDAEDIMIITKSHYESNKPVPASSEMGQKKCEDLETKPATDDVNIRPVGEPDPRGQEVEEKKDVTKKAIDSTDDLDLKGDLDVKDRGVDSLVEGIAGCCLRDVEAKQEVDVPTEDLSDRLTQLDIHEAECKKEKKDIGVTRRNGPQEDDESEVLALGESRDDSKKTTENESPAISHEEEEEETTKMVKLAAPTQEEEDEEEDDDQDESVDVCWTERSPANGVPVYQNRNANQMTFEAFAWNTMNSGQQPTGNVYTPATKGKRGINDLSYNADEAPKYFRPQTAQQQQMLNNLDAPDQPHTTITPSNVIVKQTINPGQMSGGTVMTADNLDLNGTPNFNVLLSQQQQQQQLTGEHCALDLQAIFGCVSPISPTALADVFDDNYYQPHSHQQHHQQQQHQHHLHQHQHQHQQQYLPHMAPHMPLAQPVHTTSIFTQPQQQHQQQQQFNFQTGVGTRQQQQQQQPGNTNGAPLQQEKGSAAMGMMMSPSKMTMMPEKCDDKGYGSDASPSQDPNFAYSFSRQSTTTTTTMDGSPLSLPGSSPPEQNYSPPPSNHSMFSQDSGICSPEDLLQPATSPYSVMSMSPEEMKHASMFVIDPISSSHISAQMSPAHVQMSPAHHVQMSPAHAQMSPAHHVQMSPAHHVQMSPAHAQNDCMSPVGLPLPPPHPLVNNKWANNVSTYPSPQGNLLQQEEDTTAQYVDSFINSNLPALSDALAVISDDLVDSARKENIILRGNLHMKGKEAATAVCHQGAPPTPPVSPPNIPSTVPQSILSMSPVPQPQPSFHNKNVGAQINGRGSRMSKGSPPAPERSPPKGPAAARSIPNGGRPMSDSPVIIIRQPVTAGSNGTFVFSNSPITQATTAVTLASTPPMVNSEGKVAIPRIRSHSGVMTHGLTPVVIRTVERSRQPVAIAPKVHSKPNTVESNSINVAAAPVCQGQAVQIHAGQGHAVQVLAGQGNAGQGQNDQARRNVPGVNDQLNLARRYVAMLETKELHYSDNEGDSYLHKVVLQTDSFMLEALLERLQRAGLLRMLDGQNFSGQTPLYLAVCDNKPEMVAVLVRFGADIKQFAEVKLDNGTVEKSAAIHRAASRGHAYLATLRALLPSPLIDLKQMDSEGHTALHCAILSHGKVDTDNNVINSTLIIEALMAAGADANQQVQKDGKTALMFALESRNIDLIEHVFRLVDPIKLPTFLKTESFNGNTCLKIGNSIKATFNAANQQRLTRCLRPDRSSRLSDH